MSWNLSFTKNLREIQQDRDWIFASKSFENNVDGYIMMRSQRVAKKQLEIDPNTPCYYLEEVERDPQSFVQAICSSEILHIRIFGDKKDRIINLLNLLESAGQKLTVIYNGSDCYQAIQTWLKNDGNNVRLLFKNAYGFSSHRISFFPEGLKTNPTTTSKWLSEIDYSCDKDVNLFINCGSRPNSKPFLGTNRLKSFHLLNKRFGNWAVAEKVLEADRYFETLARSRFVWCPPGYTGPGNRLFEALYFGCIPVVLDIRRYHLTDVPQVIVKSLNDITIDHLEQYFEQHRATNYSCFTIRQSFWNQVLLQHKNY